MCTLASPLSPLLLLPSSSLVRDERDDSAAAWQRMQVAGARYPATQPTARPPSLPPLLHPPAIRNTSQRTPPVGSMLPHTAHTPSTPLRHPPVASRSSLRTAEPCSSAASSAGAMFAMPSTAASTTSPSSATLRPDLRANVQDGRTWAAAAAEGHAALVAEIEWHAAATHTRAAQSDAVGTRETRQGPTARAAAWRRVAAWRRQRRRRPPRQTSPLLPRHASPTVQARHGGR